MVNAPNFAKGVTAASKILGIIETPTEGTLESPVIEGDRELTREQAKQDIEFHNVWFKYPLEDSKWVLRDFSLTIRSGECVGFVGESGCGKSTIIQLLMRFYNPQQGHITIGGTPIS
eukprot:CAMPEP_0168329500 /NCGR_PEP_ID=MMETSP0213-20121227/7146_1 /TAXON_ID=151035 /ORGANISM="Euplotes harpa, Strain FSP1.4" /LENGTH=116 /DNA_ID=CAMNT_0008332839 /DNA_START=211 /DNA_END=557 /DNA_ORIENTATION=-